MGMTKTAWRMWIEGRWEEYVDLKGELRSQGLVGMAFKSAVDRAYPPLSEAELEERRASNLAPRADEVEERRFREERVDELKSRDARAAAQDDGRTSLVKSAPELELFDASAFERSSGKASQLEEIDWVKEHLAVKGVRPEDAPSSGAFAMWQTYSRNWSARQFFFEKVWPKVLPSIRDLKQAKKFSDDGRKLSDLEDGVAKMADAAKDAARGQWQAAGVEV